MIVCLSQFVFISIGNVSFLVVGEVRATIMVVVFDSVQS